jgi:hypothetical protein
LSIRKDTTTSPPLWSCVMGRDYQSRFERLHL